jgi:hypothetical protein
MGTSYPDKTNARGIWKLSDIYKNKISHGTFPRGGSRGIFMGGFDTDEGEVIDYITIASTGDAADFGDLSAKTGQNSAGSSFIRGINFSGGGPSSGGDEMNIIDYITMATTGNAADFGDLTVARRRHAGFSNETRAICSGGRVDPANKNEIDFVTIATLGNATDFGNLSQASAYNSGCASFTRGITHEGYDGAAEEIISYIDIASTGNATDFADCVSNSYADGSLSDGKKAVFGGNNSRQTTVQYINIASGGSATDYSDLTLGRSYLGGTSAGSRGVFAGGKTPSMTNVIDYYNIQGGTFADFGDLTVARGEDIPAVSDAHGGLNAFDQRAPELYSPTGKVVPRGGGQGDIGMFGGGEAPGGSNQTQQEFISISTLGNGVDFGNASFNDGTGFLANTVRFMHAGHSDPAVTGDISLGVFSTKGNNCYFGDLSQARYFLGGLANDTRGLWSGGDTGSKVNTIDYITNATFGNATDFGDLQTAKRNHSSQVASTTRGVMGGGQTPTAQEEIDYVTIASTGNGADFGNLVVARGSFSATSSSVRGLWGAGSNTDDEMDYITIASTGNATDFGNLTVARYGTGTAGNSTRGVWGGGRTPSFQNTMDYVTIASTGNAADFGDIQQPRNNIGGSSNGHGGLS